MRLGLLGILLLVAGRLFGQGNSDLALSELDGNVRIEVTIFQGSICAGLRFFRSTDSINFEQIGVIQGNCGSNEKAVTYTFTDHDPHPNQVNYYRVELVGIENTPVKSIMVVEITGDHIVWPNPVQSTSVLYFRNSGLNEVTFSLFDLSGMLAKSIKVKDNKIDLGQIEVEVGTYFFNITSDFGLHSRGKLMIVD